MFSKGGPVQSFRLDKPSSGSVRKLIIQNYLHLTLQNTPHIFRIKILREETILMKVTVNYLISLILKCVDGHHWLRPEPVRSADVMKKVIPVKQRG